MKVFKNVLHEDTLAAIEEERNSLLNSFVWKVSDNFWTDDIKVGITGCTSSTLIGENARNLILRDLNFIMPKNINLMFQHYIWHRHSGISKHDDWGYRFGMTIYLNKEWNSDWGGLFIWQDKKTGMYGTIVPNYNTLIFNDEQESHMVTTISPLAPYNRITIQIWGLLE